MLELGPASKVEEKKEQEVEKKEEETIEDDLIEITEIPEEERGNVKQIHSSSR
jgi:hypothetical protein